VRVWETETGLKLFDIRAGGSIMSAEFSPDDLSIITANSAETCEIWNGTNGLGMASFRVADYDTATGFDLRAEFSPDSQSILTYGLKGPQFWWSDGRRMRFFVPQPGVRRARLSQDCRYLLLACADHTARVWDLISAEDGKGRMEDPTVMMAVNYSRDGHRIITVDEDADLIVWDASSARPLLDQLPRHPFVGPGVDDLAFSIDRRRVLGADWNDHVRIYDTQTGQPAGPLLEHGPGNTLKAVFSSDADRVVTADQHGTLRLWLATAGRLLHEVTNAHRGVSHLDRQPHGKTIATAGSDRTLRFWNESTLEPAEEPVPLEFVPSGIWP